MFFTAGRRLVTLVVLSFATLGFLAVPIGERTGYEHTRALLRTKEAGKVGEQLLDIGGHLRGAVFEQVKDIGAAKDEDSGDEPQAEWHAH